jgi:hypothetical protein
VADLRSRLNERKAASKVPADDSGGDKPNSARRSSRTVRNRFASIDSLGSEPDSLPSAPKSKLNIGSVSAMDSNQKNMMFIIAGAVGVVVVVVIAVSLMRNNSSNANNSNTTVVADSGSTEEVDPDKPWLSGGSSSTNGTTNSTTNGSVTPIPTPTEEELIISELDSIGVGVTDLTADTVVQNDAPVEENTFLRDLKGEDVPEYWEVSNIVSVSDYVSYVKHRAITADGIELYWLDGTYKGKPCKIQISYKIFKELDLEGVVPVDVEVVKTKGGQLISTYFTVRLDYKALLNKGTSKK